MQIINFIKAAAAPDATIAYCSYADNGNTGANPQSFATVGIGTPSATRQILVAVTNGRTVAGDSNVTGVTVGGVSATSIADIGDPTGDSYNASWWIASVPTGTTATVAVSFNNNNLCGIHTYEVHNAASTASDTITLAETTLSGTIDCPAGGVIAAVAAGSGGDTLTWAYAGDAGLNEDHDYEWGSSATAVASAAYETAQTGITVTATPTGTANDRVFAVVAIGPA